MSNIIKPVAAIGSAVPGPWQPWAAGASALMGAIDSNKQQAAGNAAMRQQGALTQEQLRLIQALNPQLLSNARDAQSQYAQLDPHADTERALTAFDQAANESAARDYGNPRTALSLRGLSGSSEASGAQNLVAAQRSTARGQLASTMTAGERERKQGALQFAQNATSQALGQGTGAYQSPINNLGNIAQFRFAQAGQYDPSALLNAFQGIKLPWMRNSGGAGGHGAGGHGSGGAGGHY